MTAPPDWSADSALIHAGTRRDQADPVIPPPALTSIFVSAGDPGSDPGYGRNGNPTWTAVEHALGAIEQAEAVLFSSGQAASMALMLALAAGRDRILLPLDGYYTARALAAKLRPHGAQPVLVDQQDLAGIERELHRGPALLWAETPTNPLLRVADLARLAQLAAAPGLRRDRFPVLADEIRGGPLGPDPRRRHHEGSRAAGGAARLANPRRRHRRPDGKLACLAQPEDTAAADRAAVSHRAADRGVPVRPSAGDGGALPGYCPADARCRQGADAERLRPVALLRGDRRGRGRRRRRRGRAAHLARDQLRRRREHLGATGPLARRAGASVADPAVSGPGAGRGPDRRHRAEPGMTDYAGFARFYDRIVGDRSEEIERLQSYIAAFRPSAASLLELGCGTGALLAELANSYQVAGVDRSPEMLAIAAGRVPSAQLTRADMTSFTLARRFDVAICMFDTLNHVPAFSGWQALFDRVHEHLAPDGLFIFDVNTAGRLRRLHGGPSFLEEIDGNVVVMSAEPGGRRGDNGAAGT